MKLKKLFRETTAAAAVNNTYDDKNSEEPEASAVIHTTDTRKRYHCGNIIVVDLIKADNKKLKQSERPRQPVNILFMILKYLNFMVIHYR